MKYYIIICILLLGGGLFAQTQELNPLLQVDLDEIVITSTKETNELTALPGSVSLIAPRLMEERKITSILDLSAVIPNFFIPRYGSKMSTPVYIRGIGERSAGQSIGLYVDNMPYLDKSVFNFEFLDVQRIEVLRGPQGTLYGRNAMSGIINVYTYSPLDYNRTRIALSAGNYGLYRANVSVARKIGNFAGISISGYYDGNNGFFENKFDGKHADRLRSGGGRLRMDARPIKNWTLQMMANYDYSEQGAFPYGEYKNGKIEAPNYDHPGRYTRSVTGSNINLEYRNDKIVLSSSSGFQYFDDNMHMDLDYTPASVFTINQRQKEQNWTQEFAVRSDSQNDFRWSFGAFGFSRNLRTDVVTTMREGAINGVLQPVFDQISINNPNAPTFTITDSEIPIPGTFKTPAVGIAFFHQSTFNNLIIDGLSLTGGIRFDYEKIELDYNTSMTMSLDVRPRGMPFSVQQAVETEPIGEGSASFAEWLPKIALKYDIDPQRYGYISIAKGHKAGGYNIQMFADIVRDIIEEKGRSGSPGEPVAQEERASILAATMYRPEHSWNYEAGFKNTGDIFRAEVAVFYVDIRDIQITQFVESGQGRLLKNAGRASSVGVDISVAAFLAEGLTLSANYGYAHAVFNDYKTGEATDADDFSGNFIPFAPQNTFSLAAGYNRRLHNSRFIDRFNVHAQYNGAGKIYWTEKNDTYQKFYGLLNLRAGVSKGIFWINVWTRNTLNTNYAAFRFNTENMQLAQRGAPFQIGVDLTVSF